MQTITICIDNSCYFEKPSGLEISIIANKIAKQSRIVSLSELVSHISKGNTFALASSFSNQHRKKCNWLGQQVFVADIDYGNLSLNNLLDRSNNFYIKPAVIYETFSSKLGNKRWRVLYISQEIITNPQKAIAIMRDIQVHLNGDRSMVDLARISFGTTQEKVKYVEPNFFDDETVKTITSQRSSSLKVNINLPVRSISPGNRNINTSRSIREVQRLIHNPRTSRYMTLFYCSCKLAETKQLTMDDIVVEILKHVSRSRNYKNYDRSKDEIEAIIINAAKWLTKS